MEYYYNGYTYTKPSLTKNKIIDEFEDLINSFKKWLNGIQSRQFSGTTAIIGVSL